MLKGITKLLKRFRAIVLESYAHEFSDQYENLDLLVQRAENRMRVKPRCPYCNGEMLFRFSHLVGYNPIRDDQTYKCPHCFHTAHFGIPLTRREYNRELELRKGAYLMKPDYREDERYRKDVLRRLKKLGYLDV